MSMDRFYCDTLPAVPSGPLFQGPYLPPVLAGVADVGSASTSREVCYDPSAAQSREAAPSNEAHAEPDRLERRAKSCVLHGSARIRTGHHRARGIAAGVRGGDERLGGDFSQRQIDGLEGEPSVSPSFGWRRREHDGSPSGGGRSAP